MISNFINLYDIPFSLEVLQILGYNPTTAEVEEMFQEMDSDGTGQLELPEFMTLMHKIEKYKQIKRTYVRKLIHWIV